MGCNASRYLFDDLDDSIHVLIAREEKRLARQGKTGAFQYRPRTDNPTINWISTTSRPTTTVITTTMAVTVIEDNDSSSLSSSFSCDVAAEGDSSSRIVATTAN